MLFLKCNINDITDAQASEWYKHIDKIKQTEITRLLNPQKKKARIISDFLCRKAISEFCGVRPDSISFSKNKYGKPFAENLPVHFNTSHSGNMVVCAVSDKKIGIDIEKIKPYQIRTAEKFATEKELEYISCTENGFFEIWTLKEAYFKCVGTGLGADIKDVSFSITPSGITCSENGYTLSFIDAENGYICSVCQKTILESRT